MATLASLIAVGNAQNLEAWWYPVWDKALQVYVAPGYVGSPNLAVGPQSALRSPPGGWPYIYPDFTVFRAPRNVVPPPLGSKTLYMVMECKRGTTQGQVMAGILQLQNQMNRATIPANDPPTVVGQSIWGIATFDRFWVWGQRTLGLAGWGPIGGFAAVFDIAVTALNTQVPI